MKINKLLALAVLAGLLACAAPHSVLAQSGPSYTATIPPVGMILSEVVGDRGSVSTLLDAGDSPHVFDPKPSDARSVANSLALFSVADGVDGWAAKLGGDKTIQLFDMLPSRLHVEGIAVQHGDHSHGSGPDGHFWTSPKAVKAILPSLVTSLSELDPDGSENYQANAEAFAKQLDNLDDEVQKKMKPFNGEYLLLFHASLLYFMEDYGLKVAAVIEPVPGVEPSPRFITELGQLVETRGVKALFSEPQLPADPVRVLAEVTGLQVYELDPLGGAGGRTTYSGLIRYNTNTLVKALER